MRYVLNSAVMTTFGTYTFKIMTAVKLKLWLQDGNYESRIGYQETADALELITGKSFAVDRRTIEMQPGDEAVVFRLTYPKGHRPEQSQKGKLGVDYILKHSEIGWMKRIS